MAYIKSNNWQVEYHKKQQIVAVRDTIIWMKWKMRIGKYIFQQYIQDKISVPKNYQESQQPN